MTTKYIKFSNTTIIDSTQGGWQTPKIGIIQKKYEYKQLANSIGELACEVASPGVNHEVELTFYNRSDSQKATIMTALRLFASLGIGTLQIGDDYYANCVIDNMSAITSKRVGLLTNISTAPTQAWEISLSITFHQLY